MSEDLVLPIDCEKTSNLPGVEDIVLLNAIVTETTNAFEKDLLEDTYTDVSSSDFVEQLNNLDMPEMDFEREEDYHFVRNRGILVERHLLRRSYKCNGHVDCHREVPQSIPLTAEGVATRHTSLP